MELLYSVTRLFVKAHSSKWLCRIFFFLILAIASNAQSQKEVEFRGVWIATVKNIDWPVHTRFEVDSVKADYLDLLEYYKGLNYNAVIVQIRTAGDAFYPSFYAPWSRFLTGEEGVVADRFEDLLPWIIKKTHQYGMEFHAWMNPYRATTDLDTTVLNNDHVFYRHREWIVKYGSKYYLNPGLEQVQSHLLAVIDEVVSNYNIDAIHFDDYFYPYKVNGEVFQDSVQYLSSGEESLSIDDWRRQNVDRFIEGCHRLIKLRKPYVQLGVSPFGVWRNKHVDPEGSETRSGQTTYDDLYANVRKWCREGWLDYIVPQAYFSMDYPPASFRNIVTWWSMNKSKARLYIGLGYYKIRNNHDSAWFNNEEILNQIEFIRGIPEVEGHIGFSAKSLKNKDIDDIAVSLRTDVFASSSLTPLAAIRSENVAGLQYNVHSLDSQDILVLKGFSNEWRHCYLKFSEPRGFLRKNYVHHFYKEINSEELEFSLPKKYKDFSVLFCDSQLNCSKEIELQIKNR